MAKTGPKPVPPEVGFWRYVAERNNDAVSVRCSECREPLVTWAWYRDAGGVSCCWPCWQERESR